MKSFKWAVVLAVGVAMGFAGGVFAAGAKKEMSISKAEDVKWTPLDSKDTEGKGPSVSVVFGDMKKKGAPVGFFLHVPADGKATPHTHTSEYYAVEVKGVEHNWDGGANEGPGIAPGGWWYQPGKQVHDNHCEKPTGECVAFIYMPNGFDFQPAKTAEKPAEKPSK